MDSPLISHDRRLALAFGATAALGVAMGAPRISHAQAPAPSKGWRTFEYATSGEGPGTIFRLDPARVVYRVVDVPVRVRSNVIQLFQVEEVYESTLGQILSAIGIKASNVSAELTAKLGAKTLVTRSSTDAVHEYFDDLSLPLIEQALVGVQTFANNSYYVMRETIATTSLSFSVKKGFLASLGLDASVGGLVKSGTTGQVGTGESLSFSGTFKTPLRVWYKSAPIAIKPRLGAGGGTPPAVQLLDPKEPQPLYRPA